MADPINCSSSTINSEKTTTTDHHYHNNNDQFVRWIRAEYLITKYGLAVQGAIAKYPVSRHHDDNDRDDIVDDLNHLLPSVDIVRMAFNMEGWSKCKVPHSSSWAGGGDDNGRERIIHSDHRRGSSDDNDDYDDLGDIIHHRLRGQVAHSGPLNAYFEIRGRDDSYEL
ncbi:hypothetical protein ACHAXA_007346 [Cyclostephanos tholiformis]|uniref:Uncharacterized protein n=1 Tax=Cyclostephanos tholiformis TaxID=382380 RepID=A0ABD3RW12_9STRA